MLELLAFLKEHWKPLACVVLVATIIWQVPAELNFLKKRHLVKQETAIFGHQEAAQRADEQYQKQSDSLNNFIKGQQYENNAQLEKNSTHARNLPAVLLPVTPPHERP